MWKKWLLCCASVICFIGATNVTAFAEPVEVDAEGTHIMGDTDTPSKAKATARENAKKEAIEKVGVLVKSQTEVKDMEFSGDEIKSYAEAKMKILKCDYVEEGRTYKAIIHAVVDLDLEAMATELKNASNLESQTIQLEREKLELERKKLELEKQKLELERSKTQTKPIDNSGSMNKTIPIDNPNGEPSIFPPLNRAEAPPVSPAPNRGISPLAKDAFNGHHYAVIDESMDFYAAESYCQRLGGHLVYIENENEQKFVENLVLTKGTRNNYWLGGKQNMMGDKWTWLDGTPITFAKWAHGQPDNRRETALMMYRNTNVLSNNSGLGEWNDILTDGTCNGEAFFGVSNFGLVCEWDY